MQTETAISSQLKQLESKKGEGLRITPISFDRVREIMRDRFDSREYWLAVFDPDSLPLLVKLEEKFYAGAANADLDLVTAFYCGRHFAVAAMKKRRMPAWKFQSLLRQVGICLTERELLDRDLLIITRPWGLDTATELADRILSRRDLAITA